MFFITGTSEKTKILTEFEVNEVCMNCEKTVKHNFNTYKLYQYNGKIDGLKGEN